MVHTKRAVWAVSEISTASQLTPWSSSHERYSAKSAPTAPTRVGLPPSTPMAKPMFPATPPRRISRSSTRKLRDTFCRCSTNSCSENLPGKFMRWSVAMDPVTMMDTRETLRRIRAGWAVERQSQKLT
ncbi:Uncharacterised protein [Mycobacteroides abscessus subsp. abscessus]|nr:Uncharacterised protein [Mycobacteroides abscessus subsp. abscessus]